MHIYYRRNIHTYTFEISLIFHDGERFHVYGRTYEWCQV